MDELVIFNSKYENYIEILLIYKLFNFITGGNNGICRVKAYDRYFMYAIEPDRLSTVELDKIIKIDYYEELEIAVNKLIKLSKISALQNTLKDKEILNQVEIHQVARLVNFLLEKDLVYDVDNTCGTIFDILFSDDTLKNENNSINRINLSHKTNTIKPLLLFKYSQASMLDKNNLKKFKMKYLGENILEDEIQFLKRQKTFSRCIVYLRDINQKFEKELLELVDLIIIKDIDNFLHFLNREFGTHENDFFMFFDTFEDFNERILKKLENDAPEDLGFFLKMMKLQENKLNQSYSPNNNH